MSIAEHPSVDAYEIPVRGRTFESLWEEHGASLSSFLMDRGVRDRDEREEYIQETYVRAFANFDSLQDAGAFRGWICTIAANAVTDVARKKARRGVALQSLSYQPEPVDSGRFGSPPPVIAIRNEERQSVVDAVDSLQDIYARAIRLRYFELLSMEEIAECENVPMGTVKRRLHTGRKILAGFLGAKVRDPDPIEEGRDHIGLGISA